MARDSQPLARLSPQRRWTLRIVGGLMVAVGLVLFLSTPLLMFSSFGDPTEPFGGMRTFVLTGFGGVILLGVGAMVLKLGILKPMSEIVATETAGAVEHSAAAWGRGAGQGLGQAGWSRGGRDIVKVKCRACGFLESEDARFCSSCAKPV